MNQYDNNRERPNRLATIHWAPITQTQELPKPNVLPTNQKPESEVMSMTLLE